MSLNENINHEDKMGNGLINGMRKKTEDVLGLLEDREVLAHEAIRSAFESKNISKVIFLVETFNNYDFTNIFLENKDFILSEFERSFFMGARIETPILNSFAQIDFEETIRECISKMENEDIQKIKTTVDTYGGFEKYRETILMFYYRALQRGDFDRADHLIDEKDRGFSKDFKKSEIDFNEFPLYRYSFERGLILLLGDRKYDKFNKQIEKAKVPINKFEVVERFFDIDDRGESLHLVVSELYFNNDIDSVLFLKDMYKDKNFDDIDKDFEEDILNYFSNIKFSQYDKAWEKLNNVKSKFIDIDFDEQIVSIVSNLLRDRSNGISSNIKKSKDIMANNSHIDFSEIIKGAIEFHISAPGNRVHLNVLVDSFIFRKELLLASIEKEILRVVENPDIADLNELRLIRKRINGNCKPDVCEIEGYKESFCKGLGKLIREENYELAKVFIKQYGQSVDLQSLVLKLTSL